MAGQRPIEVRGFKWPHRPTASVRARLLGEDAHGRWLGVGVGDPWRSADGARGGTFVGSLVKVVPAGTFWTACFYPGDPAVDVDIVLPVRWDGDLLEEIDLELDILRAADGTISVRDRDAFARVCAVDGLPDVLAARALAACDEVCALVAEGAEPFGRVGRDWLSRFMASRGLAR